MSAILCLGPFKFALESAAVASAIADALRTAPQVAVRSYSTRADQIRYRPAPHNEQILSFQVERVENGQLETVLPTTPATVQAVLGEPTKSRRRTHKILTEAARELRGAKVTH